MAIYPSLRHLPVLVTGGGAGIGAAIVRAFARQQAHVAFLERDEAAAQYCVEAVIADGLPAPHFRICDLRDIDATFAAVDALSQEIGAPRVLVNNAGNDEAHALASVTPAYFDDRVAVNLRHQFFLAQKLAPGMAEAGGGSIINLGSVSWEIGARGVPVYTTLKSAIEGLTRTLARELGEQRIRVNAIAPGWVLTDRQREKGARNPEKFAQYLERQCLKEHLEPEDVAETALWLAAAESRRCTGHVYYVDAGVAA
ncbi:MAG: SDR family NAD(P)-dependent oxidoreductase [Sphingomonas sp.]|uniref:SDR family NAD(P)-dependent oxidoreductase n=1 Tax=Sphingomonas sp. TaxID=28214 RepID=UPI003F7F1D17